MASCWQSPYVESEGGSQKRGTFSDDVSRAYTVAATVLTVGSHVADDCRDKGDRSVSCPRALRI